MWWLMLTAQPPHQTPFNHAKQIRESAPTDLNMLHTLDVPHIYLAHRYYKDVNSFQLHQRQIYVGCYLHTSSTYVHHKLSRLKVIFDPEFQIVLSKNWLNPSSL